MVIRTPAWEGTSLTPVWEGTGRMGRMGHTHVSMGGNWYNDHTYTPVNNGINTEAYTQNMSG